MKKLIFANDEEKKIIRHLHESAKKGIVIKELDTSKVKDVGPPPGWYRNNMGNDGALGYWIILFNVLTKHGIPVKWENSDGDDSTYMYWNGWVIFKDLTTNGGYPILFKDSATNVSTKFKFLGGKYAGQPADKIILDSESINLTFNLGLFGKYDNKTMSEYIIKYQKSHPIKGKWDGVTVSPLDTDKSEKVDDNDSMISDVSIGQRDASDFTYKSKKVKRPPNPSVTELQKNLNAKFSSGLVEDGYLGAKTRKAIYNALTKGAQQTTTALEPVKDGTSTPQQTPQQTTQQTTTALEPVKDETLTPGEVGTQI